MIPITVGGHTYTSISSAWRALSPPGLPLITVRWRLRNGWNPVEAFCCGVVPPENRRKFKDFRTTIDELSD